MKIVLAADHAGFSLKEELKQYLITKGYDVVDCGTNNTESTDYPIYGKKAAHKVVSGECPLGILICGSGVGISLSANKVEGIRAVLCSEPYTAQMARAHNDSNMLAMGARVVGIDLAKMIVDTWLATPYEASERHAKRVDMIESDLGKEC